MGGHSCVVKCHLLSVLKIDFLLVRELQILLHLVWLRSPLGTNEQVSDAHPDPKYDKHRSHHEHHLNQTQFHTFIVLFCLFLLRCLLQEQVFTLLCASLCHM